MKIGRVLSLGFFSTALICQVCSAQQTSSPGASTSTPAPTPATQKGTAFGQVINAAITAALPGISAAENVIAALFKKPAANVTASATTKVSAQAVTDAVKNSAVPSANAAQAQLTALQGAVTEIATVNMLASNAQTVSAGLTASRTLLVTSDWNDFKPQWEVAKTNLAKVTSTDAATLGKISDENVLLAWRAVNEKYVQWISEVDTYSARKNLPLTLASLDQLSTAIQSLARIPSVELELISNQLQNIKAQVPGNNAPEPPSATTGKLSTFMTNTINLYK